jgi:sorbitol/mannitol transport system permease protein
MTTATHRPPAPRGRLDRIPIVGLVASVWNPVRWPVGRWLMAPALIYVIAISQVPFLVTIWYSLQKWNLTRPELSGFGGLDNYVYVLTRSTSFWPALINTLILTVSAVGLALIVGLAYAELVNHRFAGRNVVRTLLITPFLVMPVVSALTWKNMMLNPVFGIIDWIMRGLGLPSVDWLADAPLASIILVVIWRWSPFMMLILLAGIQALSDEVREAARVDGATAWQEFRFITIPHLKRYMQLSVLLGTVYVVQEFDIIYMGTQGGPGTASMNLPFLIYRTVFVTQNVGQASAMGVVVVLLTILVVTQLVKHLGRLMEGGQ